MKATLVIGTVSLVFAACQPAKEPSPPEASTETKLEHPSDWIPNDPDLVAGRQIYHQECSLCHDEGEEGAPPLSNVAQWTTREAKGLPTLIDHALNGFNGEDGEMPPRGGTETLTDEEVTKAVKFMIAAPK